MTITFLDVLATNNDDLDWSLFSEQGELKKYDLTSPKETLERIQDAEIVVTNKVKILREHMQKAPELKLICVTATGYDIIDLEAAKEFGITVCNVPAYSTESVVQTTFALLLELTHHVGEHDRAVKEGEWTKSKSFWFTKTPLVELSGKTFLVVGYGNIGKRVAEVAQAFGMKVIISSFRNSQHDCPFEELPLNEALEKADVLSLHLPFTPDSKEVVNQEWIGKMKRSAFLINTSRGGLINEAELAQALRDEKLAGYAADVLSTEPPTSDNPLLSATNCILTPHFAWASLESRQRLWKTCAENIRAFLSGNPQNVVS